MTMTVSVIRVYVCVHVRERERDIERQTNQGIGGYRSDGIPDNILRQALMHSVSPSASLVFVLFFRSDSI